MGRQKVYLTAQNTNMHSCLGAWAPEVVCVVLDPHVQGIRPLWCRWTLRLQSAKKPSSASRGRVSCVSTSSIIWLSVLLLMQKAKNSRTRMRIWPERRRGGLARGIHFGEGDLEVLRSRTRHLGCYWNHVVERKNWKRAGKARVSSSCLVNCNQESRTSLKF